MESERRGVPEAKGMTELLADCLGKRVLENIDVKSRYYGNSHVHRLKQRAMQNLLILETSMSKERREQLLVSVCDSLAIESHQPSVKYLQEWLLVRILTRHPDFRGRMWEIFQQVGLKRPGCMGSFIAVMYHLTKTTPQEQLEQFVKECLQHILPCCMAQQFSVRLYAQVVIHKLWELILSCNFEMVVKEYKVAYDCLNSGFDQANNVQKNLKKLKENFYFHAFHPTDHFSLETIFYEIPRLSNVSTDEWIAVSEFEIIKSNTIIPLQNTDNSLKQQSADYSADPTIDKSSNLQKKIMPWKCSDSQPELEFFSEVLDDVNHRNYERNRNREEGLIVVASLIDRMPNLGGLCRTCEAFNVSEYVLGSLKYIEDKQFQNLSVTAENWIPVSEIKPFMLAQYLKSMKEGGYALIGAEQTSNSKRLNDFKFPKKCLLLLGNEKGGIPADLLPLLDECVEVPQQGVIRSLNVHVTGALFVWEYARQNSCCNT
ncbi:hypothetical protein J437_LFUL004128 [Ladona fulva]|uniref:tRNA (guanosine(18)-2'-O)-methyltransferase TARBP1 n=1 Tax=Ladona fulva TaxID=123851 RepID=A0A8K0JWT6_LADFU|nr:hypothetical protein J437_LFUL004128 [Ladona fulva]